jgi:hypothetical protein
MKERVGTENPFVTRFLKEAVRLTAGIALVSAVNTYSDSVSTHVAEASGSQPNILFYCTKVGENPVYTVRDNRRSYTDWVCRPTKEIP